MLPRYIIAHVAWDEKTNKPLYKVLRHVEHSKDSSPVYSMTLPDAQDPMLLVDAIEAHRKLVWDDINTAGVTSARLSGSEPNVGNLPKKEPSAPEHRMVGAERLSPIVDGVRTDAKLKVGDRVKRSDADDPRSIPAYRDMRGTVKGFDWTYVLVHWDIDPPRTPWGRHLPEELARAEE